MNHRPTKEQIKAIKAKYRKTKLSDRHDLMVKNLHNHDLLTERMNATDIAFSHKKNFGGVGAKSGWINPHYVGHYNKHGVPDDELSSKNFHNRSASRYGQGGYGLAVPKGDRRSGRQEYDTNKQHYVNYAGNRK